ncbi:DUF4292 domain-containing protein [Cytophagaceae bacterium ABcell3]|nr:DUF4292 domain-containing protein [Cytophagaceae bacterium ABcell3]
MSKTNILSLLLLACVFTFSCSRQNITKSTTKADEEAVANFDVQQIDFQYFSSKAKVHYKDGNNDMNANMNIRIKKDEVIWASLTHPLGIEGARILVKPDSIYIHDKINNSNTAYGLDFINQTFDLDLSFQNLQAILLGNLPMPKGEQDRLMNDMANGVYQLHQENGNIFVNNYVQHENMKLVKLDIRDALTGNAFTINYNDFGDLDDYSFPYRNVISGTVAGEDGSQDVNISIIHNRPNITDKELSFPFNMPN